MGLRLCIEGLLVVLLIADAAPAVGSQQGRLAADDAESLRSARRTFVAVDEGRDGSIGAREASQASIPEVDFRAFDFDGDGALSLDEFFVYYARLLVSSGREIGTDLGREVARVCAARTARGTSGSDSFRQEDGVRPSVTSHVAAQLERAERVLESGVGASARLRRQRETPADLSHSGTERRTGASGRTIDERLQRAQAALDAGRGTVARQPSTDGSASESPRSRKAIDRDLIPEQLERARRALDRRELPQRPDFLSPEAGELGPQRSDSEGQR